MASAPRVVNRMPEFVKDRQQVAARAMTQVLVLGASEASTLTPIDTSTLLNSQYKQVEQQGSTVRGRVGFTAEYALPVHDPANPQNFRRASAEKLFLTKGFERAKPQIDAVITGALRT